jgi:uncharacterized protein YjbI with pentapeptide repeats
MKKTLTLTAVILFSASAHAYIPPNAGPGSDMRGITWNGSLTGNPADLVQFPAIDISNADISNSTINQARFVRTQANGLQAHNIQGIGILWDNVISKGGSFVADPGKETSLVRNVFIGGDFTDTDFTGVNLYQSVFYKTVLCGAKFTNAQLDMVRMDKVKANGLACITNGIKNNMDIAGASKAF